MSKPIDPNSWWQDANAVAVRIPAASLFSLLRRSYEVPANLVALAARRDGTHHLCAGGETLADDNFTEVLLVQDQPLDLAVDIAPAPAKDEYLCQANVAFQVRIPAERSDLEAFRDRVMGSRTTIDLDGLALYFQPAADAAVRELIAAHKAGDLVESRLGVAGVAAAAEALRAPCFAGGMALEAEPHLRIESAAYTAVQQSAERTARQLDEHRAQSELRASLADAQHQRLTHLEEMISRLKTLADESPDVALPELMRAFTESQRGELYHALFASRAKQTTTQWIAAVAGSEVLLFSPNDPEQPARRIRLNGEAGALRSIQAADADRPQTLLVGAARGAYVLTADATEPDATYVFPAAAGVRGGINAVAGRGADVVATHSEQGVIHWTADAPDAPNFLMRDETASAGAVRNAQFCGNRFYCTLDDRVVALPANALNAPPQTVAVADRVLTSLAVSPEGIYAGDADGNVIHWTHEGARDSARLHGGSRRPAESVTRLDAGGIARLLFTDTSLAVFSRVLGDSFCCRYEAGGQTIRRAACATDVIAAINDARDRVILWHTGQPEKPVHIIPVSRLTGRSVQDICLIPFA